MNLTPPQTQSSATVLMVRPARFGYNEETAENNAFMRPARRLNAEQIVARARREFEGLAAAVRGTGAEVIVVDDTRLPPKPDAVFPNNWFSTHADGTLVLYPMYAPTRRAERDNPVVEALRRRHTIHRTIDLTPLEEQGVFLEGTGSLVLDRVARVAYLCRSERSHEPPAHRWAELLGYDLCAFGATDADGLPIYHTNVIMAVGSHHVVICLESVDRADRARVRQVLSGSGKAVIDISFEQVKRFAGNMLEVLDGAGRPRWVMSSQAHGALSEVQRAVLGEHAPLVHADIEAIEQLGGGSARCMIAEVFLPPL